ncbi:MAG: Holliday junction branch migration protein RuvA [Ignavibacteria bacterium]|nr:Holliday junction branch migration protein RuvA [Ignavibacteria bacterium]
MIEFIKGKIISKKPTSVIIESNNIGYNILSPVETVQKIGDPGDEVTILTHLHLKDNPISISLYGFKEEGERECFRQIISISGVGPKTALSILSSISYTEFNELVLKGNHLPLTKIPGVGKKTAERLIVELKDKINKTEITSTADLSGKLTQLSKESEILSALMSLGYNRTEADKMLKSFLSGNNISDMKPEEIIKEILRGK